MKSQVVVSPLKIGVNNKHHSYNIKYDEYDSNFHTPEDRFKKMENSIISGSDRPDKIDTMQSDEL